MKVDAMKLVDGCVEVGGVVFNVDAVSAIGGNAGTAQVHVQGSSHPISIPVSRDAACRALRFAEHDGSAEVSDADE